MVDFDLYYSLVSSRIFCTVHNLCTKFFSLKEKNFIVVLDLFVHFERTVSMAARPGMYSVYSMRGLLLNANLGLAVQ